MIKPETKAKKIMDRVAKTIEKAKENNITASFYIEDLSCQKEQRLRAEYEITYNIGQINYPKNLEGNYPHLLWTEMRNIQTKISNLDNTIYFRSPTEYNQINLKTKSGPEQRSKAEAEYTLLYATQFLDTLKKFSSKTNLKNLRRDISILRSQQKELIPQMRKVNSAFIQKRKLEKEEIKKKNQEVLTEGRFWEVDKDTLKDYFHTPFQKNYLADVSAKWRAALFLECKSASYKRYNGTWGHILEGTGQGYLCGIDDNGDEWGHEVFVPLSINEYGTMQLDATVEEAMAELFDISINKLGKSYRQGDLLFCPETIPGTRKEELGKLEDAWEVKESHQIYSKGMRYDYEYFQSTNPIIVSHTSHNPVFLPAGEYKLYPLQIADAD